MPRANVGTLLENIVLVEVTKSLVQSSSTGLIDFINSFVMPPLSEWRSKDSDYGLDTSALQRVSQREDTGIDYRSLMAACTRSDSLRGPNGALLFNLILRLSNRVGRFWLNDAPDDDMRYKNEPFDLAALDAVTAVILKSTSAACEVATCRQLFPESLTDLQTQLNIWRVHPSVARLGYLDPDMYSSNGRAPGSPHTDAESVQAFLRLLREGFDGPIANVHFTANQMEKALEAQIKGLKDDGQATGYDVCVCRHGRFAVVVHCRQCDLDFANRIRDEWNSWCIQPLSRQRPFALRID